MADYTYSSQRLSDAVQARSGLDDPRGRLAYAVGSLAYLALAAADGDQWAITEIRKLAGTDGVDSSPEPLTQAEADRLMPSRGEVSWSDLEAAMVRRRASMTRTTSATSSRRST